MGTDRELTIYLLPHLIGLSLTFSPIVSEVQILLTPPPPQYVAKNEMVKEGLPNKARCLAFQGLSKV